MVGRYTRAHQFKQERRALKFLRTRLGRLIRDIGRNIAGNPELRERFAESFGSAVRVRFQDHRQRGPKIYALRAPKVECIGKCKAAGAIHVRLQGLDGNPGHLAQNVATPAFRSSHHASGYASALALFNRDAVKCHCQQHSPPGTLDTLVEMKAMSYIYSLPLSTAFDGRGLFGYSFGPLKQKDIDIYYIEVEKGHDTFMISKKIARTYYVLDGSGYFTIADRKYDVSSGMLVEVPPKVEYAYSGKMKLIAFSRPRWFMGNDTHTKWNPDVVQGNFPCAADGGAWLTRLVRLQIFRKSPIGIYLGLNRRLWNRLPASFAALGPIRLYGNFLHGLARIHSVRAQAFSTYFLRNRPQLELIGRLLERDPKTGTLRVAVLGCSTGAEAYSVAWRIRTARPDLKLILQGVDISKRAVKVGQCGVYSLVASQVTNTNIFERVRSAEMEEMFDRNGDAVTVKSWLKKGIEWHVGDVGAPELFDALGGQDMVIANNFLCHMDPAEAERCLRNIARLVSPHGYLFVSGIDLDIRTKVAADLGWKPLQELLEEIHEGDPCMKGFWPCHYGGLEPLNKRRRDWRLRYAAAFQLTGAGKENGDRVGPSSVEKNLGYSSVGISAATFPLNARRA
jgi:SAM-dependent methyltransferase/mannose-6-phosphate isomerase-like protein (cupin superfamily)